MQRPCMTRKGGLIMANDDLHGDEHYREASPLEDAIQEIKEELYDLRYRMNALCTFLSMRYPDDKETLELAEYR